MRIKLIISYDGTRYGGWQLQKNAPSIQGELENVLKTLTGKRIVVQSAGRTDAGVHALGQTAHFDYSGSIPPQKLPFVFNSMLPKDIRVTGAWEVSDDFHARYDAKGKRYIYTIYNSPHSSALLYNRTMHVPQALEFQKMRAAAQYIIGTHDFKAFCAAGSYVKSTVRTVSRLEIAEELPLIRIIIEGNGFLYNMVRAMVGTCVYASEGKLSPDDIPGLLEGRNRTDAGPTAPPQGLYMTNLWYPVPNLP